MNTVDQPKEKIICQNFIDGTWVKGEGGQFLVNSPYYGTPVGEASTASKNQIESAINAADKAFQLWSITPIKERTQSMFRFREIMLRDLAKISQSVSLESGKTLAEAKAGVLKGIEVLEYALSLQNSDQGGRMEVSRGVFCEYRRQPLGVVCSITPFNFPAMVPMWTIPIALTLGNCFVWKPSDKTPLTSILIANALSEAGLPKGVFTVLQGGPETVRSIIEHQKIKAVSFVGSSPVAEQVYKLASQHGKRALALGGAKNHIVLLPDADPVLSGNGISDSFTGCAGQRCMAASVVLAVGEVEVLIQKIVERASSLKLGEDMGAIITKDQVEVLSRAISEAESQGAKILLDGRKSKNPQNYAEGFWLGPTIIDGVKPGTVAATKELFGPILSIVRCENISQALEIENANPYGNACSVFTRQGDLAEKVISGAKAGMIGVNIGVPVPREPFSFGGINYSKFGHGDITGPASLGFWSDLRKVTTKWEKQADANWMS